MHAFEQLLPFAKVAQTPLSQSTGTQQVAPNAAFPGVALAVQAAEPVLEEQPIAIAVRPVNARATTALALERRRFMLATISKSRSRSVARAA